MSVAFASDVVGASPTSSPHSSTPDFPEEDPTREALDKWIDAWDAYAATNGYAPMLQGRDPPSVIQFTERDLTLIPALPPDAGASAIAAREALRAQVIHDNSIKSKQRADTLCDHRHRFALLLIVHLRPRAGLRLQRLLSAHIVSGTVGASDALYDGIAMYLELRALRAARMTKPQRDAVRRALADMEQSPLADGCSVQAFSSRARQPLHARHQSVSRPTVRRICALRVHRRADAARSPSSWHVSVDGKRRRLFLSGALLLDVDNAGAVELSRDLNKGG
ncbi:hypothetical protein AB1Y20_006026 [Prymnesium parvum]|uniref:Uncharacterized protein n=1 Tax=Prymnesium parvum TaxID=97485 RepID=A0AB34J1E4_PRYPA